MKKVLTIEKGRLDKVTDYKLGLTDYRSDKKE